VAKRGGGGAHHDVWFTAIPSGVWNEVLDVGVTYTHTFNTPGTYSYFCIIHVGQNGRVTVNP
jgi:plastocyanin